MKKRGKSNKSFQNTLIKKLAHKSFPPHMTPRNRVVQPARDKIREKALQKEMEFPEEE